MKKRISVKKVVWTVLAVVLIGACVLCAVRWKVWFGQPEEEPYPVSQEPWRVMLTFGNSGELSRNVSWQCDSVVRKSYVEIACDSDSLSVERIDAKGEVFQSRAGKAAYYFVRLDNLKPDCVYRYRAVTDGKASEWYSFRTYPEGSRDFSFIYVGDVQDTINGEANSFLRRAFASHKDAEFLLCGGDLTERPRDADWAETFRALDSLRTAMPILAVTGNHDYLKQIPRKLERRFSLVFSYFLESMVGENQVYEMRYGDAHFFLLDSNRELPYLLTQKSWLEERLDASDARWKILVIHHPLYSMRGNNNLLQKWVFADLVESKKVDLVLQGHEHNYGRMKSGNTVYTISHCSPKTYSHKSLERFDVTFLESRFYQYVRVHGDSLVMATYEVYRDSLIDLVGLYKGF